MELESLTSNNDIPESQLDDGPTFIGGRSRHIWAFCAATSLFTSKHLLVDVNLHYPMHLLLAQFAAATALALYFHLTPRIQTLRVRSIQLRTRDWALLIASTCLTALSMPLTIQAILHFQNMSTLAMLPVSKRSFHVKGLIFAIPAALFFGASNSLSRSLEASSGTGSSSAKAKAMFYCSGLTITAIWAIFEGSILEALRALRLEYTFLLATNAFSTAVAIVLGNSVLFPLDISSQPVHPCSRNCARALLVLTGVIGCGSTVMLRRSYTTFLQLCAFLAAMLCIQVDAILDLFRQFGRDAYRRSLLLPPLPDTDSELCPSSPTSDVPAGTQCSGLQEGFSRVIRSLIVSVLMVASLWIIFVLLNFSESLHMHRGPVNAAPVLDLIYSPSIPAEIVISMYKEPIDSVASLISSLRNLPNLSNSRVHIYTKDETADTNGIQHRTGANNMTKLPNIGREGETYLYHILSQWDSLAKHTLFIQGSVHNSHEFFARVHAFFDPDRTGMLSLGFPGHLCNCDDCGDEWGWKDAAGLVPQLYSRVYTTSPPCSKALLSYKGQFIASAKRIRGLDKAVYRELREALVDEHSWAHQEKYLDGREDSMSAPDLGYTLERLWNVLLQCSDLDVAWKCPSLLSGKRWGGGMEDCQCFDG